jgi:hypothetical protein
MLAGIKHKFHFYQCDLDHTDRIVSLVHTAALFVASERCEERDDLFNWVWVFQGEIGTDYVRGF